MFLSLIALMPIAAIILGYRASITKDCYGSFGSNGSKDCDDDLLKALKYSKNNF